MRGTKRVGVYGLSCGAARGERRGKTDRRSSREREGGWRGGGRGIDGGGEEGKAGIVAGFGAPGGGDDEGEEDAGAQAVLALPSGDVGDASPMAASPLASSGCPAPNPSRSASSSSISSSLTERLSTSSGSWPLAPADAPRTGCGLGGRCGASSDDGDDDDEGELRSRHHSLRRCSPAVGSTSVPSASSGRRSQRRARPGAARAPSARE